MAVRVPLFRNVATDGGFTEGFSAADDLDMQLGKITNLLAGTSPTDAVTLAQLTTGISWSIPVLVVEQLDDFEGLRSAALITLNTQPLSGDNLAITDGTTTRTYQFGAGGDVTVTIGANVIASMQNLAAAIEGDGSAVWGARFSQDFDAIDATGVIVIIEDDNNGVVSRIFGVFATQSDLQHVDFADESNYVKKALSTLDTADPGAGDTNFGVRFDASVLVDTSTHFVIETGDAFTWDDAGNKFNQSSGSGSIPDATSAPGGGVKGKITADENFGLEINSGILKIDLDATPGLEFNSGDLRVLVDPNGGVERVAAGIGVKLNGTTLQKAAAGLSVKGLPLNFEINAAAVGATVTAANLDTLTASATSNADALHTHDGLANLTVVVDEAVIIGDVVFWNSTTDRVAKADANVAGKKKVAGIITSAQPTPGGTASMIKLGRAPGVLTGATNGRRQFLQVGGGAPGETVPSVAGQQIWFVGWAINATELDVQIQDQGKV